MSHTLLLADDSVTIQRVIELTFADEDVQVIAVGDGDQAIARIDAAPPDIVLADIGMPGKNGYQVAEHVKRTPRLAHIPVVLLTGAFEPIDQAKASAARCDGVLAKPFEPQLVIGRVRELLARGRAGERVQPPPPPEAAAPTPKPAAASDTDFYFDRLDAAFASLTKTAPHRTAPPAEPFAVDVPVSYASPPSAFDRPPLAPVAQPAAVTAAAPSIAAAVQALLAAEQRRGGAQPLAPTAPASTDDEIVERVTRRVLEQLSDRAVRETVASLVSDIAERLVREEIERIKASVR